VDLSETCSVLDQIYLRNSASRWLALLADSRQPTELACQIPISCIRCWDTPDDEHWTCPKYIVYFIK